MRDMILVEKIVELMSLPRATRRDNAQPSELAVTPEPPPQHDKSVNKRLAHTWQFGESAAEIALPCFENELAAFQRASLSQRLEQPKSATFTRKSTTRSKRPGRAAKRSLVDAKPFAREVKLTFSRAWLATRVGPNRCGMSTTGSVFSNSRIRKPRSTCNCWKHTLMIRSAMKSLLVKWAGPNCWMRRIGARRSTRCSTKMPPRRTILARTRQRDQPRRLRSIACIAPPLP